MRSITSSQLSSRVPILVCAAILCSTLNGAFHPVYGQFVNFKKAHGKTVLKVIKKDIEKRYYDPKLRGIDLERHFKRANEKIDSATSTSQLFGIIAETVLAFGDSHTRFYPPERSTRIEYGWQMRVIGDRCYVVTIKPGSDGEAKGLEVGSLILSVDGYEPNRENLWKFQYAYYTVRPQPGMRLIIQSIDGRQRQLDVMAKVTQGFRTTSLLDNDIWKLIRDAQSESRLHRQRYHEFDDDLIIWKMPQWDMDKGEVDKAMGKVRKSKALVLDLRGNGGGAVSMLERLTGYFFEEDVKIADLKGRKKMKPMMAKTLGKRVFKGKLVVLVDSQSGSASEIFARVMQLEGRGTVMGDRTAGAVMQSRYYGHRLGLDIVFFYGTSITNADLIMSDGKSLENVGVTPDEILLPTMEDLASERDPLMARAAALVGVEIGLKEAGSLFPIEWRK